MAKIAAPAMPVMRENRRAKILDPFDLPPRGKDEVFVYVSTFKEDSPFFLKHVGGVSFQKYVLPPEHSLRDNADKTYFPEKSSVALTEKQAEAIIERSKIVEDKTPRIYNPDGTETPAAPCVLYDHIVLEKASDYAMKQYKELQPKVPGLDNDELGASSDDIKSEIIEQQKISTKKRK